MELIEVMARRGRPVGVSDLARELGAPRASIHQRLKTLLDAGWVEQDDRSRYQLTLRVAVVGQAALEQAHLGSLIRGPMEDLAGQTREAVSVAVIDGIDAVIVQRIESAEILRADIRVGTRMPLAHSASGHVLLAFASLQRRARLTELGVSMPSDDLLERILHDGSAVASNEYVDGISAAAAPLFDRFGAIEAALSLAAPTSRFNPQRAVDEVRAAAGRISLILSGSPAEM